MTLAGDPSTLPNFLVTSPAATEYWRHSYYSYIDHQLDPLLEVIRDQASPSAFMPASATELRGMIDAVRAAMNSLEADLLPVPPTAEQAEAHGLVLGRQHVHDGDPDGSWCVYVGARGSTRQVWHLRYAGPDRYGDRNRRVISRGGWARETAGTDDALFALACRIYDGELDVPEFTFPAQEQSPDAGPGDAAMCSCGHAFISHGTADTHCTMCNVNGVFGCESFRAAGS